MLFPASFLSFFVCRICARVTERLLLINALKQSRVVFVKALITLEGGLGMHQPTPSHQSHLHPMASHDIRTSRTFRIAANDLRASSAIHGSYNSPLLLP